MTTYVQCGSSGHLSPSEDPSHPGGPLRGSGGPQQTPDRVRADGDPPSSGAGHSSSLDPQESTLHLDEDLYRSFRHSGWQGHRRQVWRVLHALRRYAEEVFPDKLLHGSINAAPAVLQPGAANPFGAATDVVDRYLTARAASTKPGHHPWKHESIDSFRTCGSSAWVMRTASRPHRYKIASNRCHLRYCVACQGERGRLIASNIREHLSNATIRFVTLTTRARDCSLADAIEHLTKGFLKLRRSKTWRSHVRGGLWVLEITYRPEHDRWHPHLHVLAQGDYFPQHDLRTAWLRATGDSFICDIRKPRDHNEVARYLTTYLTKAVAKGVWSHPHRLAECIVTLHAKKLIGTFGSWARLKLLAEPQSDEVWENFCPAPQLLARARRGEPASVVIAASLWRRSFAHWLKENPP